MLVISDNIVVMVIMFVTFIIDIHKNDMFLNEHHLLIELKHHSGSIDKNPIELFHKPCD